MNDTRQVLSGLEPAAPLIFFEEISHIPRPSYHEEKISEYLEKFAVDRGLEHYRDALGNVIIIKEASAGRETSEPVVMQGHMDMVCEKEAGCSKDMMTKGLDLEVKGDLISARGTTLGADDGVAVCIMLALLDDEELSHPRLECVFTVSEETGMEGAAGIDLSPVKGRRLINIDSEIEHEITVGCAGGARINLTLQVERMSPSGEVLAVSVGGLKGGHSGIEIDKGRANAALVLADVLTEAAGADKDMRLVSFNGGGKDNAIPAMAKALITCDNADEVRSAIGRAAGRLAKEYAAADPGLNVSVEEAETPETRHPISRANTENILGVMLTAPRGVIDMTPDIPDLVQTSLNMGISDLLDDTMSIHYSIRSSVAVEKEELANRLKTIGERYGFVYDRAGDYPAWEKAKASPLCDRIRAVYHELTGDNMDITVIHAGLECGILADKLPGLDAVSIGPDILDIHTPAERLSISSLHRIYDVVRYVITEESI